MKNFTLILLLFVIAVPHSMSAQNVATDVSGYRFVPLYLDQVMRIVQEQGVGGVVSPAIRTCDIPSKQKEARALLESVPLTISSDTYRYTERRAGSMITFRDPEKTIALALMDLQTCVIETTHITKRGNQLIAEAGYVIEPIARSNGIQWNNWATEFAIRAPLQRVVILLKYPYVREERVARTVTTRGKKSRIVYDTKNVVVPIFYTPYSRQLHTPEIVQGGIGYLSQLAARAYADLKERGVVSLSVPDSLVADVSALKMEYVMRLAPIEHMDLTEFLLDPAWTSDRIHVVIGVNGDASATYTCSKASACGLMQYTKGTYDFIRKLYPHAGINPDFDAGARDQFNAMKAATLLHDYNASRLVSVFGEEILSDPNLEEYLAAAYNTGIGRVLSVVTIAKNKDLLDWTDGKGTKKATTLLPETKGYIAKLRYLRDQWMKVPLAQVIPETPDN
ncbi:MAG: hypothetical protein KBC02_01560 [Candidatus Pacebacteria bacterium]|nr:hypothetical protein [Candidatus Paceibacterota bacterium]